MCLTKYNVQQTFYDAFLTPFQNDAYILTWSIALPSPLTPKHSNSNPAFSNSTQYHGFFAALLQNTALPGKSTRAN